MTKSRIKPANWSTGEKLLSTQMNSMDAYWPDVVDGAGGGSWTPTAQISLLGTGGGAGSALNLAGFPTVTSQTVTRLQPLVAMAGTSGAAIGHAASSVGWFDVNELGWDLQTGSNVYFAITNIPDYSTLTVVNFMVRGKGCTTLPSTMPGFSVEYLDSSGTIVEPTPQTYRDTTAVAATFAAWHTVTLTLDAGVAINHSSTQIVPYVRIDWSSTGSVGITKFLLGRIACDFTVTRLTP